jgi:hypothetical protein
MRNWSTIDGKVFFLFFFAGPITEAERMSLLETET